MSSSADVWGRAFVAALTAKQSAALDRGAHARGVAEPLLMENAGRSAALILQSTHPEGRVVAAIGPGRNGGDALVVLRTLRAWGRDVAAHFVRDADAHQALAHGFDIPRLDGDAFERAAAGAGVLVDGILGTGAHGAPRPDAAEVIRLLMGAGRPVVALDLPSGVDPDSGAVPGDAVRADVTVCFGAPKRGLLFQPGRSHCGRLMAVEIGFPPIETGEWDTRLITPAWAAAALPVRDPAAHKGSAGMVLVVAGGRGMGGAAILCVRGAIRAGAGLVYAMADDSNREALHAAVPDAVFIDRDDAAALSAVAGKIDVIVAGMGMGTDERAAAALELALETVDARVPVLLDADALTLLAAGGRLAEVAAARPTLLTPHAAEFARVADVEIDSVRADPVGRARELAARLGCWVLLKGLPSIVVAADGIVRINTVGSSDLAAAGMGDTLAGVIGAMMAAGSDPGDAAAIGLFYSSRAADLLDLGRALSPTDLAEALPRALGDAGRSAPPPGLPFVTFDQPPRH
ncbi:MAG TPA: NAD(P)H-hydrate dehydratase [Longimicrobiales bacterium]|nr:NAD(P)H-hydrate dehydratase [Longimicrobiales bacterium]